MKNKNLLLLLLCSITIMSCTNKNNDDFNTTDHLINSTDHLINSTEFKSSYDSNINYFIDSNTKICFAERFEPTYNNYVMTCVPCTESVLKKIYENDTDVIVSKDTIEDITLIPKK